MSPALVTEPDIAEPDDFYATLTERHRGLGQAEGAKAKLVLLSANHIGDTVVLDEAIALARPKAAGSGRA